MFLEYSFCSLKILGCLYRKGVATQVAERTPEKNLSRTTEVYARTHFYCKTHEIPNVYFSEHELLAVPWLAFSEAHA